MYLKTLTLSNFRSFGQSEILLCKDLTMLVGENNGGRSNAIDAIKLLTAPLGGRRELYCETTDVRFGSTKRIFELVGRFKHFVLGLAAGHDGSPWAPVCTENLIRVGDVMESPKLAE
jgi:recombinational DNA repair ATPase RecF